MVDVAQLGLEVKADGIEKATSDLDKLSGSSKRAEDASKGLSSSTATTSDRLRKMGQATAALHGPLGGVASRFRSLGMLIRETSLGMVGMTLALGGATLAMRKYFQEFKSATIELERVQAQLASVIASTGGAAGRTVSQLNDHANALQRVTTYGNDAIAASQGVLLTFTQIHGQTFDRATEAILDYATAMRKDLQSATLEVGKALNDPILGITALGRAGVTFSEAQKDVIKSLVETGEAAAAQAMILKELETQFGGSARRARETLGGALTALGEAWGDLFKVTGDASNRLRLSVESLITSINAPAFGAFVHTIGVGMFGAFEAVVRVATWFGNQISTLTTSIDGANLAATGLVSAFIALRGAMVAHPFIALGTALAGIVTYLTDFETGMLKVGRVSLNVGGVLKAVWTTIIEGISIAINYLGMLANAMMNFVTLNWGGVMADAQRTADSMEGSAKRIAGAWAKIFERPGDDATLRGRVTPGPQGSPLHGEAIHDTATEAVSGAAAKLSEYERATASINRHIEAMKIEAETYGMATREAERYRTQKELENAALRSGLELTPALRAEVLALADSYGRFAEASELAAEAQRRLDDVRSTFQGSFSGFVGDISRGTSALGSLASALQRVADKLIDMAANDLFENAFGKAGTGNSFFGALANGGGSGGLLGGVVFPGILHDGGVVGSGNYPHRAVPASVFDGAPRYHNGGIAGMTPLKPNEVPAILERGERVIPKGQSGSGGAAPGNMNINVNVEGANGDAHVVALVEQGVSRGLKAFPKSAAFTGGVVASIRNTRDKNALR